MIDDIVGVDGQRVHMLHDGASGLHGAIVIDSVKLGPAAGGCRLWHYADDAALLSDARRLARGMSYKNALAGLPFGGGKAVIARPSGAFDRAALFAAFGRAVAALDGAYITAEDVGTTIADMDMVRARTSYVAGLNHSGANAGGDPSPWTALGVFEGMKAAVAFGHDSGVGGGTLRGKRVAVQGAGNVGAGLARLLAAEGAELVIADIDEARAAMLAAELGARVAGADEILTIDADVLAPCALGGVLNARSIPLLRVGVVCGGANNQLATTADGEALRARGIIYAPDYVVNAGGIINVAAEYLGEATSAVHQRIMGIGGRLRGILAEARLAALPAGEVADAMARQIIAGV